MLILLRVLRKNTPVNLLIRIGHFQNVIITVRSETEKQDTKNTCIWTYCHYKLKGEKINISKFTFKYKTLNIA